MESKVPPTPGAAAFLTPHLILAATLATVLSQLGLSLGFISTITLFLALDFLSFRCEAWGGVTMKAVDMDVNKQKESRASSHVTFSRCWSLS